MHAARRSNVVERGLFTAAFVVGRSVARAAEAVTALVQRTSGLEEPSPEATVAAVVRGVTALAPRAIGGPLGAGIELAGAGAVLAIAGFALRVESEVDASEELLTIAIADAEVSGLCSARRASLWRAGAAVHRRDRAAFELEALRLFDGVARSLSIEAIGLSLGRKALSRAIAARAPAALRLGLGGLALGRTLGDVWLAMGDAARLVEATRSFAARRALPRDPDVIALPARAA